MHPRPCSRMQVLLHAGPPLSDWRPNPLDKQQAVHVHPEVCSLGRLCFIWNCSSQVGFVVTTRVHNVNVKGVIHSFEPWVFIFSHSCCKPIHSSCSQHQDNRPRAHRNMTTVYALGNHQCAVGPVDRNVTVSAPAAPCSRFRVFWCLRLMEVKYWARSLCDAADLASKSSQCTSMVVFLSCSIYRAFYNSAAFA
jgi:hypothetical protein